MTALDGVNGTVCNAQQYQQSLQSYNSSSPWISCLTPWDVIGLAFTGGAAVLSCICVAIVLFWIGRNFHWYKKFQNGSWRLFQGPGDVYMFSLFVFDFLQAFGGTLNIRWAHNGIVTTGPFCTAQGLIEQIGELGVALITLFLAVHSFVEAVSPVQKVQIGLNGRGVALSLVSLACFFITLSVAIGAGTHKNFDSPTPYWCWISPQFPKERLVGEYVWLWIALFASMILYIPLHFWAEGFWSIEEKYKFHWWNADKRVERRRTRRRTALGMLLYPLTYSVVVLPLSIARWLQFTHHDVPSAATFFGTTMFHLSGAINVFLFLIIRPNLLLFPRLGQLDEQEMQLASPGDTGAAIFSDTMNFQHNPGPTPAPPGNEGSRNSATPSHVNPRQVSGDSDI